MRDNIKKCALRRAKKKFRGFVMRHPWIAAVLTFLIGVLAKSVAGYLFTSYALPRLIELGRSIFG